MTADAGRSFLEARWNGAVVTSFAQNAEDVRLWRVFASRETGFYVDVGAGHPVSASVTKLFYDAGWSGLNIEPGPNFPLLAAARPRDTTLDVAIASRAQSTQMWVVSPYSELSSLAGPPTEPLPEGATATRVNVETARLDEVIDEHAPDQPIDFLKIDVEGAERDVLESFDPSVLRPTVIVVEAIAPVTGRPNHDAWEFLLFDADYVLAGFDGINRFYVANESAEIVPALGYPISPLDRYVLVGGAARAGSEDEDLVLPSAWVDPSEMRRLQTAVCDATDKLTSIQSTVSWRITRPLRAVRRLQRGATRPREVRSLDARSVDRDDLERAVASRLAASARLLMDPHQPLGATGEPASLGAALDDLREALGSDGVRAEAAAWLILTAVDGRYPPERDVEHVAQVFRTIGRGHLMQTVARHAKAAISAASTTDAGLDVIADSVVIDVSQIASSDLHTGVQRVARECVSHWLRAGLPLHLSYFDNDRGGLRLLADEEADRLRWWQNHLGSAGRSEVQTRRPQASDGILVPWSCQLVLPELSASAHSAALRGVVTAHVPRSLCAVCYDLIPFVAPETVDPDFIPAFAQYLALIKHADRVSAISHQSADDLRAYASMLRGQGLRGPEIATHPLPTEAPAPGDVERNFSASDARQIPMVLVVGVHTPRKNHLAVLEASERLWRAGHRFELVFMGGSSWRAEGNFDSYMTRLQDAGMPVRVEVRVSENALWNAYRGARFTVFPSLIEGFGLPVAESLAVGTPVITSSYGSMAEIATGGGALMVDPRDVDDLERHMRCLLEDDRLVERLRREARGRDTGAWSDYARDVWEFFTGDSSSA